jgi:hypothetical protein
MKKKKNNNKYNKGMSKSQFQFEPPFFYYFKIRIGTTGRQLHEDTKKKKKKKKRSTQIVEEQN